MKKFLLSMIPVLLFSTVAQAEDFYIAQSSAGGDTGADCANAHAVTFFNDAGNWGTGAGKVSAGDTVHLCGTITTTLTVQGSGSAGSPVTIIFESGSKLSKAYWDINGAIKGTSVNYITIDGNNVGVIENTANGDSLANQQVSYGISVTTSNNWTIKNLTIQNIYVHVYDNSSALSSRCISITDSSTMSVFNCTLNNAYYGIAYVTNSAGAYSAGYFYNNTISACSTAIAPALGSTGTSFDDVKIYGNTITMGLNWYDTPNNNHVDGIHAWAISNNTDQITNLKIYGNSFSGNPGGHSTAYIYLEYDVISPQIYNNLMVSATDHPSGHIRIKGRATTPATTPKIWNNTIIGLGSSDGIGVYVDGNANTTIQTKNNIFLNLYVGIYAPNGTETLDTNYNDFYGCGSMGWIASGQATLANWQTASGGEANSIDTDPGLDGSYKPGSASNVKWAGTATGQLSSADKLGISWHSPPSIGAYEYDPGKKINIGAGGTITFGSGGTITLGN